MKYIEVIEWSAKGDSLQLDMLGEDQEKHRIEIASDCLGALAGALAAEAEKRNADHNQGVEQQFLRPTGMQTGKTAQGEPLLFMTLKGGVELPLVFKKESLRVLISELEKLARVLEPDSQVRWR